MSSWHGSRRRQLLLSNVRRKNQTRKYCGLTRKEIFNILSSLALPLMLGVFTVVITFDQKNLSNQQRLEDRRLSDEQRNQDLNISHEQRREDRELSREQRLQDLNQSILQRELERTIADETRNISEQSRIHQLELEDKRYRDNLLINYISEMSHLLELNNGSLTNNDLTRTLVRLKTLTLIRQLDSNRNSQVIRFLYEAGQLNTREKFPLDLSESDLFHIDLSSKKYLSKMSNLYLPNVDLTGSSFVNRNLTGSNLSSTILIDVNFSFTNLINIDLSYTVFNGSFNIYNSVLRDINFSYANLKQIDFRQSLIKPSEFDSSLRLYSINFSNADLTNSRFSGLYLTLIHFREISDSIDFSNTILADIIFENVQANHLNFSYSSFTNNITFSNLIGINNSSFDKATMNNVKFITSDNQIALKNDVFDFSNLSKTEFIGVTLSQSSFVNAIIVESTFSNGALENCNFINVRMSNVIFDGSIINTNFDDSFLKDNFIISNQTYIFHSTFRRAQMQNLIADFCEFFFVDMNGANLTDSTMFASQLTMSNLINTDFTGANLSMIDLSGSNMFNAIINDEQLHSAFSIENTILPNGTIAHDIPLIQNGDANCNLSIEQNWKIEPPYSIIINKSINNQTDCIFIANQSLTINTFRTMSQTINVTRFKPIFYYPLTKLRVISDCNDHVKINLIERDIYNQILKIWRVHNHHTNLSPNTQTTYVELKLQFDTNDNNTAICDNIQFKIELNSFIR